MWTRLWMVLTFSTPNNFPTVIYPARREDFFMSAQCCASRLLSPITDLQILVGYQLYPREGCNACIAYTQAPSVHLLLVPRVFKGAGTYQPTPLKELTSSQLSSNAYIRWYNAMAVFRLPIRSKPVCSEEPLFPQCISGSVRNQHVMLRLVIVFLGWSVYSLS